MEIAARTPPGAGGELEATSHNLIIRKANDMLAVILDDPFLTDQRGGAAGDCSVELEAVQSQVALLQGKAITIYINKLDGQVISVIVLQGVTLGELIQAFQRKVEKLCAVENRTEHLSWQYVWENYCLVYGQTLLEDSSAKLARYGIGNLAPLHFTKKLKKKLSSHNHQQQPLYHQAKAKTPFI